LSMAAPCVRGKKHSCDIRCTENLDAYVWSRGSVSGL
jgi:hypothetical protein